MWHAYTHTHEYYTARKNEVLSFAAAWIKSEVITSNKINQVEEGKYDMTLLMREV